MQQPDRTTPEVVMRKINEGTRVLFVDVRSREDWAASEEMIGGAVRIPPDELDAHVSGLPLGTTVVVYCSSAREEVSVQIARELIARGFSQVSVLEGGFENWKRIKGTCTAKPAEAERRPSESNGARHEGPRSERLSERAPDTIPPRSGVTVTPREGIAPDGTPLAPVASRRSAHRS